ncbi:unnamed protein product [Merluccius merluccius]
MQVPTQAAAAASGTPNDGTACTGLLFMPNHASKTLVCHQVMDPLRRHRAYMPLHHHHSVNATLPHFIPHDERLHPTPSNPLPLRRR